jgi:hypothetical protein
VWLLLLLVAGAGGPFPAQAQEQPDGPDTASARPGKKRKPPPVNMGVLVGYDGYTRMDRLTPVRVVLDNNEGAVSGRLEVRGWRAGSVTEMPVDLPRKAHKEYTLFVLLSPNEDSSQPDAGEIRLFAGRRELARQPLAPKFLRERTLVLSSTGDGAGLQFLNDGKPSYGLQGEKGCQVSHLSPQDLPRQWPAYQPADVVALNGRAWSQMDDEQKRAFRMWVEGGGHAILCGEATTEWRDPEGQALAGVLPNNLAGETQLRSLGSWAGIPYRATAGSLLTVSGPLNPGSAVLLQENGRPLAVRRAALLGRVVWIGFDAFRQTLRDWDGFRPFWRSALAWARKEDGPHALNLLENVTEARGAASALPRLPVPPMPAIIAFGVLYAVIFGPLNIWMLRRLRRTVRSWLFMPGLALGMTLVVLFVGQSWGNARTVLNNLSVLQAVNGGRTAYEQSLVGLFSPTNRAFDLSVDDPGPGLRDLGGIDAQDAGLSETAKLDRRWPDHQGESGVSWDAVALELFSIRLLKQERPRDLGGSVQVSLQGALPGSAANPKGTVRNGTGLSLKHAYLASGGRYYRLGDLAPGAQTEVTAGGWTKDAPQAPEEPLKGAQLLENRTFQEKLKELWRRAPDLLASQQERKDLWLVAECDRPGGLEVAEVPYNNRAGLLLVRVP